MPLLNFVVDFYMGLEEFEIISPKKEEFFYQ